MDQDALKTLITAIFSAGGIGGTALLFGIWDRKRQARQETLTGTSLERKELSDNWREYIARIEAENERRRQRNEEYQASLERCYTERDWVWAAFRKFEGIAHALRHEAINRIWMMHIKIEGNGGNPEPLTELPAIHTLYDAEKGRSENDVRKP